MDHAIRSQGLFRAWTREVVPAGIALVLAEAFYKFHSFTLELVAFAATWYALSRLRSLAAAALPRVLRLHGGVTGERAETSPSVAESATSSTQDR